MREDVTMSLIGWAHSQNDPCITCSLWGETTSDLGVSNIGHWSVACSLTISVPVYGRPAGILGYQRNILEQLGWSKKSNLTQTPLCHTRGPCPVWHIDTLRLRQNGGHFADDIFKYISLNENFWILNEISLEYVPMGLIDNMAALVQIMAWRWTGDKPLSEPISVCCTGKYIHHSA